MKRIAAAILAALMLAGCAGADESSGKGYVDLDSKREEQQEQLNSAADLGFDRDGSAEYDEKQFSIVHSSLSTVGTRIYWFGGGRANRVLDTRTDSLYHLCNKAGCAHAVNSPGCTDRINMSCGVASTEGIYFVSNDTVMLFDGTEQKDIYKNKYSSDFSKMMFPDAPSVLAGVMCYSGKMYLLGPNYFCTFDPESGKAGEPVELTDANTYSYCMNDEYLFYSNENLEFFSCRLSDNKIIKLGDKVSGICTSGGELYYLKWEGEIPCLMHADGKGENAVQLIENCYGNYVITDKAVYYQHFREEGAKLYVYDLESDKTTAVDLSCNIREDAPDTPEDESISYPQEQPHPQMIWNRESGKVYVIDELYTDKDSYGQWQLSDALVMFVFKNGSAEFEIKTDGV